MRLLQFRPPYYARAFLTCLTASILLMPSCSRQITIVVDDDHNNLDTVTIDIIGETIDTINQSDGEDRSDVTREVMFGRMAQAQVYFMAELEAIKVVDFETVDDGMLACEGDTGDELELWGGVIVAIDTGASNHRFINSLSDRPDMYSNAKTLWYNPRDDYFSLKRGETKKFDDVFFQLSAERSLAIDTISNKAAFQLSLAFLEYDFGGPRNEMIGGYPDDILACYECDHEAYPSSWSGTIDVKFRDIVTHGPNYVQRTYRMEACTQIVEVTLGFRMLTCGEPGTAPCNFIDERDGQSYNYIFIGTQAWMQENLNFSTESGSWCYDDNAANCDTYGRLYNVTQARNVCPAGWKLPTKDDFTALLDFIGRGDEGDWDENTAYKLMDTGNAHWTTPNDANNESGFSALPGGYRFNPRPISRNPVETIEPSDSGYAGLGEMGYWWSKSIKILTNPFVPKSQSMWIAQTGENPSMWDVNIRRRWYNYGLSVRCIKE